jgi:hypothetical protein
MMLPTGAVICGGFISLSLSVVGTWAQIAATTASTVMQISSVASENRSFMPVFYPICGAGTKRPAV